MTFMSESGGYYMSGVMDDILCDGSSDLVCVVRTTEREKRRGKQQFYNYICKTQLWEKLRGKVE